MSKQAKVELSTKQQELAYKLSTDVLRRVKGHDEKAKSQAKYMAFHKCSAAGMTPEEREAFLELVQDLLERVMVKRAGDAEQPPAIKSEG